MEGPFVIYATVGILRVVYIHDQRSRRSMCSQASWPGRSPQTRPRREAWLGQATFAQAIDRRCKATHHRLWMGPIFRGMK